jgi:hypothetical protein
MRDEVRRLVEESSSDWDAVERSRQLIEEHTEEEEDELERALRRALVRS